MLALCDDFCNGGAKRFDASSAAVMSSPGEHTNPAASAECGSVAVLLERGGGVASR
jgi:hypothetical protein